MKQQIKNNLQAYCHLLGISPAILAKKMKVGKPSAFNWFKNINAVPDDAVDWVAYRYNEFEKAVSNTVALIDEQDDGTCVALIFYTKNNFARWGDKNFEFAEIHQAIVFRIAQMRATRTFTIRFDAPSYLAYLQDRQDTQTERASWAVLQLHKLHGLI